jgi:hypothetical protein
MTRYELHHRALREPVTKVRAALPEGSGSTVSWTRLDMEALLAFEARTGPLVDDLVAAVREEQEREDILARTTRPAERGEMLGQLIEARRRRRFALAALDEAAK